MVGSTSDGTSVWEVSYYELSEAVIEATFDDGSVFCRFNDKYGYLKTQDGYYFRAELVEKKDGSVSVRCYELSELERIYRFDLKDSSDGVLADYISLNEDGNILTVSAEILNVLNKYRDEFYIGLYAFNHSYNNIDYWMLVTWLNK